MVTTHEMDKQQRGETRCPNEKHRHDNHQNVLLPVHCADCAYPSHLLRHLYPPGTTTMNLGIKFVV